VALFRQPTRHSMSSLHTPKHTAAANTTAGPANRSRRRLPCVRTCCSISRSACRVLGGGLSTDFTADRRTETHAQGVCVDDR
jgi:hypothetical protein